MVEKWLIHRLEFLNSEGTTCFRLDKPTARSPIILSRAPAGDAQAPFIEIEKVGSNYAIPVLSLLAIDAANRGDGLQNSRIYPVVWSDADLYAPLKRSAINAKTMATRIHQEIRIIRRLVGRKTVLAIHGGYRLTVDVKKGSSLGGADSGGWRESEPAQAERSENDLRSSLPHPAMAKPPIEPQESPIRPAEMRAEARVRLTGHQTPSIDPGAANLISLVARLATGIGFSGFLVWLAFRHPSPAQLRHAAYYGLVGLVILVFTVALVAIVARRVRKPRPKDTISIHVARLGVDKDSDDAAERVITWIRDAFPPGVAEVLPAKIRLNVTAGVDHRTPEAARRYLREKDGDVLIWGKFYSMPGMKVKLDLRFSIRDSYYSTRGMFGLTDEYQLDADFGPELGSAIAAVAVSLALPAVQDAGAYLSAVLKPMAEQLSKLVGTAPEMYAVDRGTLLNSYGLIQLVIGDESEDEERIREAVRAFRAATTDFPQNRVPLLWALAQNNLGHALLILAERESGTDRLKEAASAFQSASDEWKGDQLSAYRAAAQNNLGLALMRLGERESGSEQLKAGINAFRAALAEEALKKTPMRQALVQNNLGTNLLRLGRREPESERLKEAVEALRGAVQILERDRVPLHWSMAQSNLASALTALCERECHVPLLEEAADALRAASRVRTRNRMPLNWALLQSNLGATLVRLGELESGTTRLHEAVTVTLSALEEQSQKRDPLNWAVTQNTLGLALMKLGEREGSVARLEAAEKAFQSALEEWTQERWPLNWAMAKNSLASTLTLLGQQEPGTKKLEEAVKVFREAAEECTCDRDPLNWAFAQNGLGVALMGLGAHETGTELMDEAIATFRGVLDEWTHERAPAICEMTQRNLDLALSMLQARLGTADRD